MSTERRTAGLTKTNTTGVYLGKIVNHLDTTFMGGVEVEILKRTESGNVQEKIACKYASPFAGQTPYTGLGRGSQYSATQKSYGFWAVPPDIGTQVIVLMPEGDYSQAFWVACVQDTAMNFAMPGNAGTTMNDVDQSAALPVGEYNKLSTDPAGKNPTKVTKPANPDARTRLQTAGLDKDWVRGTNTSSARRELPSMVFGISTPGPHDTAGPTHRYGPQNAQINAPYNRLGGSSFVMDDGDTSMHRRLSAKEGPPDYANTESGDVSGDPKLPANELVRIQTRTGHQILLHNTEDLVYISHGSGDSWIEMTANGKIDIYSKDSISIRSEADLNFTADRDINFTAKENINMLAEKNIKMHSVENTTQKAKNYKMHVEEDSNIRIDKDSFTYVESDQHLYVNNNKLTVVKANYDIKTDLNLKLSQQNLDIKSDVEINLLASGGNINLVASQNIAGTATATVGFSGQNVGLTAKSNTSINSQFIGLNGTLHAPDHTPGNTSVTSPTAESAKPVDNIATEAAEFGDGDSAFYTKRRPEHEPWAGHEHLKPTEFTPELTIADETEEPENVEDPPFPTIKDTFK